MNLRSIILLCVALVTGTSAAIVTKMILNSIPEEGEVVVVEEKTVPTMVAKRDLLAGDEITPQNVRFDRLPESQVPAEVINFYHDAKNRTLTKSVGKGQLISIFDLNNPEETQGQAAGYLPLNSSFASFVISSVVGCTHAAASEEFYNDLKRHITPGVDKADFSLTSEKREDDSDSGRPQQRLSTVEKLLEGVEIYQVRTIQRSKDSGEIEPCLELTFILSDSQLETVEDACSAGRVTIELVAGDNGGNAGDGTESPLFEVAASAVSETAPVLSADSEAAVPTAVPVSSETAVDEEPAQDGFNAPAVAAPPRMSVPRPRMSVPRTDSSM